MRLRLTPRIVPLTEAFSGLGTLVLQATHIVRDTLGVDTALRQVELDRLRAVAQQAELARSELLELTRDSFVTPFDRGDIHQLATTLAAVLPHLERAVDLSIRFQIEDIPQPAGPLIDTLVRMAEVTAAALPALRDLSVLAAYPAELRRLAVRADQARRDLLTETLTDADGLPSARLCLVLQEVTAATSSLEQTATVVEGIVVKES